MSRTRLSDITIDKVGGLENGAIVVCTKDSNNLTKGKHYVLISYRGRGIRARWYVMNDGGVLCSEMKFFVHLKDWREKQLGDLGI
jgi:hypothetical protein